MDTRLCTLPCRKSPSFTSLQVLGATTRIVTRWPRLSPSVGRVRAAWRGARGGGRRCEKSGWSSWRRSWHGRRWWVGRFRGCGECGARDGAPPASGAGSAGSRATPGGLELVVAHRVKSRRDSAVWRCCNPLACRLRRVGCRCARPWRSWRLWRYSPSRRSNLTGSWLPFERPPRLHVPLPAACRLAAGITAETRACWWARL
jgi:hypothetical protein